MQDTKSLKLLRSLNKDEFFRLGKFLCSPFYSYSKASIALYEYLKKYYPDFDSKKLTKEKVWTKLFPGKPFNENSYWKLCFSFFKLLEKFLVALQLEAQPNEEKKMFIRALGQRHVYGLFVKESKTLLNEIEKQPYQDIHSYSDSLWLKHDYFFNSLTDKYGNAAYTVEDAMEDLDRFYLLAKLRFAAEIKNRERMFSKKVPIKLLEECLEASDEYAAENPTYLMYKNVLHLYMPEKAEAAYQKGKKLLEEQFFLMSKHDQNEVMLNLRNYAIRELNKGRKSFLEEVFALFKVGIKLDLIVVDGKISEATFGNIAKVACGVKEFEWAENFIESYEKYLDEKVREDARTQILLTLHFEKDDFDETIRLYGQHEISNKLHRLSADLIFMKAWFSKFEKDKQLYDLLISTLGRFQKFNQRRKDIPEQRKMQMINFILPLRQLSVLVYRKETVETIEKKMNRYLSDEKEIFSKTWLKEMVAKYTKK